MAYFDWGNKALRSWSTASLSNPTSSALLAEIDSTQFGSVAPSRAQLYTVTWTVGASSSNASFRLEQALSTGLGSTALRDRQVVWTGLNQSAVFVSRLEIQSGDRLRVLVDSTFTGNCHATIQAEPLT